MAFISMWTVDYKRLIRLPLSTKGIYDFDIDWGDETPIEHYISSDCYHKYKKAGDYTITITGTLQGWRGCSQLCWIKQWGCLMLTEDDHEFGYMKTNAIYISAKDAPNLSLTTSLSSMFECCGSLKGRFNHWDVSNITDMTYMFSGCKFDEDISKWNVSNVRTMYGMFHSNNIFNHSLNDWDVSNVEDMREMFRETYKFNRSLNKWNTSKVRHMSHMFMWATSFNQDISEWDVSNVEDMTEMFHNAHSFNHPLNSWNVSNVEDMSWMFMNTHNFNQPLSNWKVSRVSDMSFMFANSVFNQDISDWDVSNVKSISYIFAGSNKAIEKWDIANIPCKENITTSRKVTGFELIPWMMC